MMANRSIGGTFPITATRVHGEVAEATDGTGEGQTAERSKKAAGRVKGRTDFVSAASEAGYETQSLLELL